MPDTDPAPAAAFYDDLGTDYYLFTRDWWADVRAEGNFYAPLLTQRHAANIADCTCGPGTQAIGLGMMGFSVSAFDVSHVMIEEARRNAETAGVRLNLGVADLRTLTYNVHGPFDAALSAGNALAHLSSEKEVADSVAQLLSIIHPQGAVFIGLRDYDEVLKFKPRFDFRRVREDDLGATLMYDYWDYRPDGSIDFNLFILRNTGRGWYLDRHLLSRLLPVTRHMLGEAVRTAGGRIADILSHMWGVVFVVERANLS